MIKAINLTSGTSTNKEISEYSKIKTAIREEPIKLAQYLRGRERGIYTDMDRLTGF